MKDTLYDTSHLTPPERDEFNSLLERSAEIHLRHTADLLSIDGERRLRAAEKCMRCATAVGLTAESDPAAVKEMEANATPKQRTDHAYAILKILDEA